MRVFLVRHGESTWNLEHRLQGQTRHVPLTPRGQAQAKDAARAVLAEGVAANVLSSDLTRATQTAEILAAELGVAVRTDERLREQSYGVLEGRLTADLRAEPVPEGAHITDIAWGGGESIADVYARVRQLLVELRTVGQDTILVTHGDTIRVANCVIDQLSQGEPADMPHRLVSWTAVGNGSVTARRLPDG